MVKHEAGEYLRHKTLYKYFPVSPNALKVFRNRELYFADPTTFNDPFDCRLVHNFDAPQSEIEKYLKRDMEERGIYEGRTSLEEPLRRVREYQRDPGRWEEESLVPFMQTRGVLCLTALRDQILMFSHYSDGHQGFCLGFSTSIADSLEFFWGGGRVTMQVVYPENFEPPSYFLTDIADWGKWIMCTKSPQWAYEKEFRVSNEDGHGPVAFPPAMLAEIIFGCRMKEKHIQEVLVLTRDWKPPISYFRARKRYDAFALHLEPFTP